jgi:uncharacterized membrane protein
MTATLINMLCRVCFIVSLVLLFLALWDKFLRLFGWAMTWLPYEPGRLFELSALLMIFVIALLLKQIKDKLR